MIKHATHFAGWFIPSIFLGGWKIIDIPRVLVSDSYMEYFIILEVQEHFEKHYINGNIAVVTQDAIQDNLLSSTDDSSNYSDILSSPKNIKHAKSIKASLLDLAYLGFWPKRDDFEKVGYSPLSN